MSKEQAEITTQPKPTGLQASLEIRGIDVRQFRVLKEVLYPNASSDESLLMAIDYCKARKLDIFKRPIQIVSIWDAKTKTMKDTFWPSITEVRITATRTGVYAGRSEAEFGEDVSENLGGSTVIYPKWCKVTVFRLVQGEPRSFTAKLYWKQEYKTQKNDTAAPNAMWAKRNYSQLEKCTEAAALRMAFPEELGNEYIAEEAFDANEALVNITPKSKTAGAHNPPAVIEQSFKTPVQMDLEEELGAIEEDQIVTDNSDVAELAFKRVSDGINSMLNPKGLNTYFDYSATDDLEYLKNEAPAMHAKLVILKNECLEKLNAK